MPYNPDTALEFPEQTKKDTPRRIVSKFEAVTYRLVRKDVHEWTFNAKPTDKGEVTLSDVMDTCRQITDKPEIIAEVFKIWKSGASKAAAQKAMVGKLGQKYTEQCYKVFNAAKAAKIAENGTNKAKK